MKYTEFKERIEERLGFEVEARNRNIVVSHRGHVVAFVNKERQYDFTVSSIITTPDEARFLARQCHNLAFTPIDERKGEKKYRIKLRGVTNNNYLNMDSDLNYYFDTRSETSSLKTKFTERDVENIENSDLRNIIRFYCDWEVVTE